MIMGTSLKLNATLAILFFTASLLHCTKTEDDFSNVDTSIPPSLLETSLTRSTSNTAQKIEPLSWRIFTAQVYRYLTPELLSQSNPLTYLLPKIIQNIYNRTIGYGSMHIKAIFDGIHTHLHRYLVARKFPRPYVPYAKFLYSTATCLSRLDFVSRQIRDFQIKYPNESDYPASLPPGILSPELRTLFDADIFSDSNIPSVLLQKLVELPNDKIPDVVTNLKKLFNSPNDIQWPYHLYMHFLIIFFEDTYDLERLRNEYLELQKLKLKRVELNNDERQ